MPKKNITYLGGPFTPPETVFIGGFWEDYGFCWRKFFQPDRQKPLGSAEGKFTAVPLRCAGSTLRAEEEGIGQEDWTPWKWHAFFREHIKHLCFFQVEIQWFLGAIDFEKEMSELMWKTHHDPGHNPAPKCSIKWSVQCFSSLQLVQDVGPYSGITKHHTLCPLPMLVAPQLAKQHSGTWHISAFPIWKFGRNEIAMLSENSG